MAAFHTWIAKKIQAERFFSQLHLLCSPLSSKLQDSFSGHNLPKERTTYVAGDGFSVIQETIPPCHRRSKSKVDFSGLANHISHSDTTNHSHNAAAQ